MIKVSNLSDVENNDYLNDTVEYEGVNKKCPNSTENCLKDMDKIITSLGQLDSFTIPFQSKLSLGFTLPSCSLLYTVLLQQSVVAFMALHEQRVRLIESSIQNESWSPTTVHMPIRVSVLSLFINVDFWSKTNPAEQYKVSSGPAQLLRCFEEGSNPLEASASYLAHAAVFPWCSDIQHWRNTTGGLHVNSVMYPTGSPTKVSDRFLNLVTSSESLSHNNLHEAKDKVDCLSSAINLLLVCLVFILLLLFSFFLDSIGISCRFSCIPLFGSHCLIKIG